MERLSAEADRMIFQREEMDSPRGGPYHGRIYIWDYPQGIKPYGHLAQYRGSTALQMSARHQLIGRGSTPCEPLAPGGTARLGIDTSR